ncbi:M20/M25/M40 family metallo-hydrolase, partial [candidate division WOR-3 bacterium]|nr:M20/M25/M40 family metallo-hydrolase [candidate division WOR-3 bacterium]
QDFRTRLALTDSGFASSEWVLQKFNSWGYTAEFDSFYIDSNTFWGSWPGTGYDRNVIATINGILNPSRIFFISGHFDAIVISDTSIARFFAPGADDNASGASATLEAARIFSNYSWEPTIKFACWGAEELGCVGSGDYARRADSMGLDIGGIVNLDMIGYMNNEEVECNMMRQHQFSKWLSGLFYLAGQLYVSDTLQLYQENWQGGSDDRSFTAYGYPGICVIERWWYENPHYHDTTDLLSTMSPVLYTNVTKTAVATMAILGLYPGMVEDVGVYDMGDGNRLVVNWSVNSEGDVIGYKVYWGLESEAYTDTHFVMGIASTTDTLTGLMADSTYYIVVRAVDTDDHESYLATEVSCVPREIPLAPVGVTADPINSGIQICWMRNLELDLAGYRVYRRINENPTYDSLNIALLTDTTYSDIPLSGVNKYYYAVRAFDTQGNGSPMSSEVYGRPITLDQGILIVDETKNGGGIYPPDSLGDQFYQYILDDYTYTEYEYGTSTQMPVFADFVPYSVVLWHADDFTELLASENVPDLKSYLDVGGNLWFMGWKPTSNLLNQPVYPFDFGPGSFIYDYLKISHVEISPPGDPFLSAVGLLTYPQLDVDSVRVPVPAWTGTMRMIEALTSVSPAEDVYTMDMEGSSSPFEGEVCGVRYLGADYKTVFLGFPLYYMDQDQARSAAQKVMTDFGEQPGVEEATKDKLPVFKLLLAQNNPNPFKGKAVINYQIPYTMNVCLKVYNITGRLIRVLVDRRQKSGAYSIEWDGKNEEGRKIGSAVYFYRLQAGEHNIIKKMTIIR